MFTFAKIRGQIGISYSDNHLVNNDYYCEKEKVQGVYIGKLASEFNLDGKNVTSEGFNKFYNNINPNTEDKLTKAKFKTRVAGLDLTCSAPKSLSVLYRLGGDERLKSAHNKAVNKALVELEKSACRRDRKGDNYHSEASIKTGNLLTTKYEHDTSRDLDPQIHTHCFVMNFTKDNNTGEFYALQNSEIIRNIDHFGRIYQNELAIEVQKLGYEIEITRDNKRNIKSFELKGLSNELLDKFSKRAKTVKDVTSEFTKDNGRRPTADELRIIKTQTREQKLAKTNSSEILKNQKSQLSQLEDTSLKSVYEKSLVRDVVCDKKIEMVNEKEAIKKALNHLTERKSVINITELKKECLKENLGRIDFDKLDTAIQESKQIIKIENNILTTKEILSEEKEVIKFANRTKGKFNSLNKNYKPFSDSKTEYFEKNKGYDYTEQRIAVGKVLNNCDQITIFRGVAGAGKTTALSEIEKALKQNNLKSYYFAPTRTAVKELKGISECADTVASLIKRYEVGSLNDIKNSVLVIDEAGLLSTKHGKVITDIAKKYNCRLILSGDSKQHSGVERGDYLRILENYSKTETVELSTIRRQKNDKIKSAVGDFSKGETVKGMSKLENLDLIIEDKNYIQKAVNEYMKFTNNGKNLDETLIIATTNREVDSINREVRYKLGKSGVLGEKEESREIFKSLNWTDEQKKDIRNYKVGDSVIFTQDSGMDEKNSVYEICALKNSSVVLDNGRTLSLNQSFDKFDLGKINEIKIASGDRLRITSNDKKSDLINGDIVTVVKVDNEKIITSDNRTIKNDFKSIDYGYSYTSHKSQGKTASNVIIAARKMDKKSAYVAPSRASINLKIYTPNKEVFYKSIEVSKNREAVHDLINTSTEKREIDNDFKGRIQELSRNIGNIEHKVEFFGRKVEHRRHEQSKLRGYSKAVEYSGALLQKTVGRIETVFKKGLTECRTFAQREYQKLNREISGFDSAVKRSGELLKETSRSVERFYSGIRKEAEFLQWGVERAKKQVGPFLEGLREKVMTKYINDDPDIVREHRKNIREHERKIESVKNDYERRNFVEKAIISLTGEVPREIKKYEAEIKSIEKKIENLGVYREKFIEIKKEEDKRKFTLEKAKAVVRCRSIDRSIDQDKSVKELSKNDRKLLKEKFDLKKKYGIEMTDKDLGQKKEIGRINKENYYKSLDQSREQDRGMSIGF